VTLVAQSSLPDGAKVIYETSSGQVGVFVVRQRLGIIVFFGFDWYESDRGDWRTLLALSLTNAKADRQQMESPTITLASYSEIKTKMSFERPMSLTAKVRTAPVTRYSGTVMLFRNSYYVDTRREVQHMMDDLAAKSILYETFDITTETWNQPNKAIILPEQEMMQLTVSDSIRLQLQDYVKGGGTLIFCGSGDTAGHPTSLDAINMLFGYSLAMHSHTATCSLTRTSTCDMYCDAPATTSCYDGVTLATMDSMPPGAKAVYSTGPDATGGIGVVIMYLGTGRIIYLGFDWYAEDRGDWPELLKLATEKAGPTSPWFVDTPGLHATVAQ